MRKLFLCAAVTFLLCGFAFAQTPPAESETDVVKITTTLIQIDVTPTDKNGKIVTDLRPDEIEIYENDKKQEISNFAFVTNKRETTGNTKEKADANTIPNLPPPRVTSGQVRRTIAIVVDDLTLSFESVYFVRRALKKFVDEQMQEGDLVAIIRTGAGIGALQQFTTDKRQLYAAIEKVKWNPAGSGGIGAFAPLEPKIDTGVPDEGAEPGERTAEGIERENRDFRQSIFATGTLGAINYVVRGMADLPGRKSVMLLSDGFKLFTKDAGGNLDSGRVLDALRKLIDQANRASVVVYTLDARGLQVTGITAADNTSGRSSAEIQQAEGERSAELQDTQDGLRFLARETGGFAVVNNNSLSGGMRKILDDQSYYLIGYEPDETSFDPKQNRYNKLTVRVTRPGVSVRYRSGFFGHSDENVNRTTALTGSQKLSNALISPFAVNDVSLRLNPLFGTDGKGSLYVRSFLHIKAQDLSFETLPDGNKKVVFDIIAVGFGDNGAVVEQIAKAFTVTIKKAEFEKLYKSGFVYDFVFPIKKAGAYQLRVALRDHATDKVGSANQFIEVPNLKKNRLTLSGIGLENVPYDVWKKRTNGVAETQYESTQLTDTALREFKNDTVLNYGFNIFNAKTQAGQPASLSLRVRMFRDGKLIFAGEPQVVPISEDKNQVGMPVGGAVSLGRQLAPGDYILEIAVTDNNAKEKYKTATQYVQFEIVE